MNKHYICHLVKEKTGKNLTEYISDKVLEKVFRLLQGTACSMEEIAFMCGFSSQGSLTRFVKRKTGKTPTEHKKESQIKINLFIR